jgi:hypothetical protein
LILIFRSFIRRTLVGTITGSFVGTVRAGPGAFLNVFIVFVILCVRESFGKRMLVIPTSLAIAQVNTHGKQTGSQQRPGTRVPGDHG